VRAKLTRLVRMTESGGTFYTEAARCILPVRQKIKKWESGEWGAENVAPGGIS